MVTGRIHSVESFGTVDGPGLRYVVFLQGCPLRCQYCHNPDTWALEGGNVMTCDEILANVERNRAFYRQGGITVTGGEPLMQAEFVKEFFTRAKARGFHTCLDTTGFGFNRDHPEKLNEVLAVTDLVLLDIKQFDSQRHIHLTCHDNAQILDFARWLSEKKIPVWIRHVYMNEEMNPVEDLEAIGHFLGTLENVKAIDVLPYHTMGAYKYAQMKIPYPLEGVPNATIEEAKNARKIIVDAYHEMRKN